MPRMGALPWSVVLLASQSSQLWLLLFVMLGAVGCSDGAPEPCTDAVEQKVAQRGSAQGASSIYLSPLTFPRALPVALNPTRHRLCVPLCEDAVAGAALGQGWVGEQPQADAPPVPPVAGRADPAGDAAQGPSTQCGASRGAANARAGEGLPGPGLPWGFPWAPGTCTAAVPCSGVFRDGATSLCLSFPSEGVCLCCILKWV